MLCGDARLYYMRVILRRYYEAAKEVLRIRRRSDAVKGKMKAVREVPREPNRRGEQKTMGSAREAGVEAKR